MREPAVRLNCDRCAVLWGSPLPDGKRRRSNAAVNGKVSANNGYMRGLRRAGVAAGMMLVRRGPMGDAPGRPRRRERLPRSMRDGSAPPAWLFVYYS